MSTATRAFLACVFLCQSPEETQDALQLRLAMKPDTFDLDAAVSFILEIENVGSEPVYVHRLDCAETTEWQVVDANGASRVPFLPRSYMREEERPLDDDKALEDLRKLVPGQSMGFTVGGYVPARHFVDRRGLFEMRVSCRSVIAQADYADVHIWNKQDGPVSAVQHFEVVE